MHSNEFHALGSMRCCGGSSASLGCTPIDHDDGMFRFEESLLLIQEPKTSSGDMCDTKAKDRITDEDQRPGFETDQKTFVRLWRLNTFVRDQYLKHGEIKEMNISVKMKSDTLPYCVLVSTKSRDARKEADVQTAFAVYVRQKTASNAVGAVQQRCRKLFGANYYRLVTPKNKRRVRRSRQAYKTATRQYKKSRSTIDGNRMLEAKRSMSNILEDVSSQKERDLNIRMSNARKSMHDDVQAALLCYREAKKAAETAAVNIRIARETQMCAALIKSVWDSPSMSMQSKILHIGALEQGANSSFKWSYAPLRCVDVSFEDLHSIIIENKARLSLPCSSFVLSLDQTLTDITLLHPCGLVDPICCKLDFSSSDENCDAVLAYAFREYHWNPVLCWKDVRHEHAKDCSRKLTVRYGLSQENES